jgi:peptide deformylase
MTLRPFVKWPDARLRTPAAAVGPITDDIRTLWDEMIETMDAMPGYGLAAPQIGVMLRLAVVDCSTERGQAIRLANPEVVAVSDDTTDWDEASPNLPGVAAKITRPAEVTVSFIDRDGNRVTRDFSGLWATSVQHQIDHLAGVMYFDHLSSIKRQMLVKKARKQKR